jgi:thioredoxin reductase (NADPH)
VKILENYDVIVIGRGPAGISAALYTVRANLKTLVIGTDTSSLKNASKIENYYGFETPVSGKLLLDNGVRQASRLGATIIDQEVTSIEPGNLFIVKTATGEYRSAAVLFATGQAPHRPELRGIKEFEGKGVSYCTTCDGFFYKKKSVGILGNGNYAVQEALELEPFTQDITIFTNGRNTDFTGEYVRKAVKYRIRQEPVKALLGDTVLQKILLENGPQQIDGLFIASGTASSFDFAVKLGVDVTRNAIVTDAQQRTNLDGVFAAGDCTGGFKQIATAVGQGAIAGKSIIEFLRKVS